jgi:hypothetical protein
MPFLGPQLGFTALDHERKIESYKHSWRDARVPTKLEVNHMHHHSVTEKGAKRIRKTKTTMEKTKTILGFIGTDLTLSDPEHTITWPGR